MLRKIIITVDKQDLQLLSSQSSHIKYALNYALFFTETALKEFGYNNRNTEDQINSQLL